MEGISSFEEGVSLNYRVTLFHFPVRPLLNLAITDPSFP